MCSQSEVSLKNNSILYGVTYWKIQFEITCSCEQNIMDFDTENANTGRQINVYSL